MAETPKSIRRRDQAVVSAAEKQRQLTLAQKELKRSGEFLLPGIVVKRKARMARDPATGEAIQIPAKTVVKARIAKQLKDAVIAPFKSSDVDYDKGVIEWEAAAGLENQLLEMFSEQVKVVRRMDLSLDRISKCADSLQATYDEASRSLDTSRLPSAGKPGAKHGAD